MASYNLKDFAQMWYIQVQWDEGTLPWHHVAELLNLLFTAFQPVGRTRGVQVDKHVG